MYGMGLSLVVLYMSGSYWIVFIHVSVLIFFYRWCTFIHTIYV
jgi:hypothetical protein